VPRVAVFPAIAAVALAAPVLGCAGRVNVDLDAARAAVKEARDADAPARAADSFARAEGHLQEAEKLSEGREGHHDRRGAARAADLAVAEAHCATALSKSVRQVEVVTTKAAAAAAANTAETDRLSARLRKAEEDQKRLEEKVSALARDLEVTETELIRTKARLKGNETKAEASAAIAEARILAGRVAEDKTRTSDLARTQESLGKAEEQLTAGNYGAALFFATKAQDQTMRPAEDDGHGAPVPVPATSYVVRSVARLRKGPDLSEAIVGRVPAGVRLARQAVSGDWVKVTYGGVTGWVHSSLLQ
jgi:SH3 domain-containing protein